MHTSIRTALPMLALCGLAAAASAEEYCVTCMEPDAKYRCVVEGGASPAAETSQGQLLCITELARSGGHVSCSVGAATSGPCIGDVRTVMFPNPAEVAAPPLAAGPPTAASRDAEPPPAPAAADASQTPQPQTKGPPQTVEQLAKETLQASGKGLKQAGEAVGNTAKSAGNAVGNAVKKTWTCLSSLFGDC